MASHVSKLPQEWIQEASKKRNTNRVEKILWLGLGSPQTVPGLPDWTFLYGGAPDISTRDGNLTAKKKKKVNGPSRRSFRA